MDARKKFRKEVRKHYVNFTNEEVEDFLETEYEDELSLEENLRWFGTYLQSPFD